MPDVWHLPPNSIGETLEFETDIRISRTSEKRDSYKDATTKFSFGYTVSQNVGEMMIDAYRSSPTATFLVPEWTTATFIRSGVLTIGQTVIPVEDESIYSVGRPVFIGNGNRLWEQSEVLSVTPGFINITAGLSREYTAGQSHVVFVAPMLECLLPEGVKFSTRFRMNNLNMTFLSIDGPDLGENPYPEYEGLPLVTDGFLTFSALQGEVRQATNLASSGFGHYAILPVEEFTRRRGQLSFFDGDYAGRMMRRKFFHFLRGRDGEFWARTGQRDLPLNSTFSAGSLTLSVKPFTSATRMVGKHIMIKEGDNYAATEITSASDVSDTQQTLQITAPGFAGTTDAMVQLMHRSRLDNDTVDIGYKFTPFGLKSSTLSSIVEVP